MNTLITICICTYNRYNHLPKAIASALEQSLDKNIYKIMVIDNSPDHEQADLFRKNYHDFPFLEYRIETTPGLSNARNVGLRECGTEYIAFMDDDAIASPDWLKHLLSGFSHFGEDVAVVGGQVNPMWEGPRPLWLSDDLLGFVSVVNWGGDARVASIDEWFAGTNIAFRTQPLLELGGFDKKLGRIGSGVTLLSNEEIAIMSYLREQGNLAVYLPDAVVQHLVERERTTQSWFRKRVAWQAVSDYMTDPDTSYSKALEGWDSTMQYFFRLPPKERTIRGLHLNTDSPELFKLQMHSLYGYTLMLLSGFRGVAEIEQGIYLGE